MVGGFKGRLTQSQQTVSLTPPTSLVSAFSTATAKYASLAKFDVVISDEETATLQTLRPNREAFQAVLFEAKKSLTKSKQNMKESLVTTLGSFTSDLSENRKEAKKVCIVHVGCTRCITSNTDHYMKIHARIPLNF